MRTSTKLLVSLSVLLGFLHSSVWGHATLQSAAPAKNAQLAAVPKEIALRFNENLETNFSSIKVVDAGGRNVLTKKAVVDAADPRTLRVPVDSLKPGRYTVQWVGVGQDGHRRTGDYTFSVR